MLGAAAVIGFLSLLGASAAGKREDEIEK